MSLSLTGCIQWETQKADAIAVWQHKDATWDIWYSVWDHDAKKWYTPGSGVSAPIASDDGDDQDPDVSSNNTFAVAVWSKAKGGSTIYYSTWQNSAWANPTRLSSGGSDSDPTVAVDPYGNALVVWVSEGDSLSYSYYTQGKNWSTPKKLNTSGLTAISLPELAYSEYDRGYYLVLTGTNGSTTSAYAARYGIASWSRPARISDDAVLDNSVPTNQRTGIAAAQGKKEVTVVWPGTGGKVYSARLGSSPQNLSAGTMPDDAYNSSDGANGAFTRAGDLYHQPNVNAPAAELLISGLNENDDRASLTFIRNRTVGLVVWWTKITQPGEIYYSYYENGWANPVRLDPSLGSAYDRNPAVTPMRELKKTTEPFCGDGVIQVPEQCEIGIACLNPADTCWFDCMCYPEPDPYCGDRVLDWFEECEIGKPCPKPGDICQIPPCICKQNVTVTPPGNKSCSCANNTLTANTPAGKYQAGMLCIDDCKQLNPNYICDPEGCFCKESRTVTPRCGDGYVSTPNTPGGGNEECDVGFGFYQPKDAAGNPISFPDTCPWPEVCDPPTCKCIEKKGVCGDGVVTAPEECDPGSRYTEACPMEGEICSSCQCVVETEIEQLDICGNSKVETGEECESDSQCGSDEYCHECECVHTTPDQHCGNNDREGTEECDGTDDSACASDEQCGSSCRCVAKTTTHAECDSVHGTCIVVSGAGSNECSSDSDCMPPTIDCPAYCSSQGYGQSLGSGYSDASECQAAAHEGSTTCYTTCIYSKFYTKSNAAGTTTCCCKEKEMFACSDCPGENQKCPDPEMVCPANEP
ncbi:hypothetical protein H0O00_01370 [Candidatus Micrarchaeota archaeon]|nr:hypothetical protein [Candidatus Micrarchaeota archaeon]